MQIVETSVQDLRLVQLINFLTCYHHDFFSKYVSLTKMSGHYTINDRLLKDSPKIATAPFKSTTERKMMQSPAPYPGPGVYRPFEKVSLKRPAAKEQTGFQ